MFAVSYHNLIQSLLYCQSGFVAFIQYVLYAEQPNTGTASLIRCFFLPTIMIMIVYHHFGLNWHLTRGTIS